MTVERYASGTPWEPVVGYCRAVRAGPFVHVSGTTATDAEGRIVAPDDAYAQTVQIIRNLERALAQFGGGLEDVVRTRVYVTDIRGDWEAVARAHREFFGAHPPASAMVEVSRLATPEMRVEIEADAVLAQG